MDQPDAAAREFEVRAYCMVIGRDRMQYVSVFLDQLVANLPDLPGFTAKASTHSNTVEFSFRATTDEECDDCLEKTHELALALSLKNKIGFVIGHHYRVGSYSFGPVSRIVEAVNAGEVANARNLAANSESLRAAEALQSMYCQVTPATKLTFAWSAIEELFNSGPRHLLETEELKRVLAAVELAGLSEQKKSRLRSTLSDSSLVSEATRNERIARAISDLLGEPYDETYDSVKALTRARGKRVHRASAPDVPLIKRLEFAERVLWAYARKHEPGEQQR